MSGSKQIVISSQFPADVRTVWERLQRIETLKAITKPLMTFTPVGGKDTEFIWQENSRFDFRLKIFGIIPFGGVHTIEVCKMDDTHFEILTHEHNQTVSSWNHQIILKELENGNTFYTDIVELYAGRLTPFITLWSKLFYRHRQKRWKRLLRERV